MGASRYFVLGRLRTEYATRPASAARSIHERHRRSWRSRARNAGPEFKLARADGETFTEQDLQGRTSVLVFYPFAFSPVCTDQLSLYDGLGDRARRAWGSALRRLLRLQLVAERLQGETRRRQRAALGFEPKGAACAAFGVLHTAAFPARARDHRPRGGHPLELRGGSPGRAAGADLLREGVAAAES